MTFHYCEHSLILITAPDIMPFSIFTIYIFIILHNFRSQFGFSTIKAFLWSLFQSLWSSSSFLVQINNINNNNCSACPWWYGVSKKAHKSCAMWWEQSNSLWPSSPVGKWVTFIWVWGKGYLSQYCDKWEGALRDSALGSRTGWAVWAPHQRNGQPRSRGKFWVTFNPAVSWKACCNE